MAGPCPGHQSRHSAAKATPNNYRFSRFALLWSSPGVGDLYQHRAARDHRVKPGDDEERCAPLDSFIVGRRLSSTLSKNRVVSPASLDVEDGFIAEDLVSSVERKAETPEVSE